MKAAEGINWLLIFLGQLIFSPLVQVLCYKYIAVTQQQWTPPQVGYFRSLMLLYVIPFVFGGLFLFHTVFVKFTDVNRGPFYMRLRQMGVLAFLSVASVMLDYLAVVSYTSISGGFSDLEFRLPFYLCLKLTLTPILTHVFSALILKRFFISNSLLYFLVSIGGLFTYEFTVFDRGIGTRSYNVSASVLGGFKFSLPTIYTFSFTNASS
jgi:hypothetical protein